MKRILASIAAAVGIAGGAKAQQHFAVGSAQIAAPAGWREVNSTDDRLTLRSADGHQQTTISVMRFGADPSFDDFKRICQHRIEAEKKASPDCFIQAEAPFDLKGKFGMFYSGGDKKSGRIFSGYLSVEKRELVIVYVEGIGVAPKVNLETFKAFVEGLTR